MIDLTMRVKYAIATVFLIFASAPLSVLSDVNIIDNSMKLSDCEFIKDADKRNYCRAITKKNKSYCEFVKNKDLRHMCRAEFSK